MPCDPGANLILDMSEHSHSFFFISLCVGGIIESPVAECVAPGKCWQLSFA